MTHRPLMRSGQLLDATTAHREHLRQGHVVSRSRFCEAVGGSFRILLPQGIVRRPAALRSLTGFCLLLATVATVSCGGGRRGGSAEAAIVSGTVTYRPRIALPPDAVVRVWVQDMNRADEPATIAEQTVATAGRQVPIPFAIQVDPRRVEPGHRYAVRAEIRGAGTLLWTTDSASLIAQPGTQKTDVVIVVVQPSMTQAGEGAATDSTPRALVGPIWRLVRIESGDSPAVTPQAREQYSIAFDSTGHYNGQADCNRFGGEYKATPTGALELRKGLTSLAACAPPSSADAFMSVLNAVTAFSVAGDELRLTTNARGSLVFHRAAGG